MKKLLLILPLIALFLLGSQASNAAIGVGWVASSTDIGYTSPTPINGKFPAVLIGATTTTNNINTATELLVIGNSNHLGLFQNTTAGAAHLSFCNSVTTCTTIDGTDFGIDPSGNARILNHEATGFRLVVNQANEAFDILSTGLVGVGTTTPYAKLSVGGDGTGIPVFAIDAETGQTAPIADFKLASTTKVLIDNVGNLGVGSTTPGSLLSVGNTGWNFYDNATSTSSGAGGINLAGGCFAIQGTCIGGGAGTNFFTNSGASTYLTTGTNLGVGTSTPVALLSACGGCNYTSQAQVTNLFAIASSSAGNATTTFNVNPIVGVTNALGLGFASSSPGANITINLPYGSAPPYHVIQISSSTAANNSTGGQVFGVDINGQSSRVLIPDNLNLINIAGGSLANIQFGTPATTVIQFSSSAQTDFLQAVGNTVVPYIFTGTSPTAQTTTANIPEFEFNNGAAKRTHAAGAIGEADQILVLPAMEKFSATTQANSTISTSSAFTIQSPPGVSAVATDNGLLTNAFGLLINATTTGTIASTTNSYGLGVMASSNATNNFAAEFLGGNVGVGTTSPWRTLSLQGTLAANGLTSSATGDAVCINTASKEILDAGGGTCTPSSQFAKHNIQSISDAQAQEVLHLTPVSFIRNDTGQANYGFVADQVAVLAKKYPDLNKLVIYAHQDTSVIGQDGEPVTIKKGNPLSFDYATYTGLLTKEVQLLASSITQISTHQKLQDQKIMELETEVNQLKSQQPLTKCIAN